MKQLRLKRGEERRVRAGHPWIFSNEIATSLKEYIPGDLVRIVTSGGAPVGIGYVNPHSLISARVLSTGPGNLDPDFIARRVAEATTLRRSLYPASDTYRVVYGESDALPGLIVDRYGPAVAVQILTAGMERRRAEIIDAVRAALDPEVIVMRNDSRYREYEGLEQELEIVQGAWSGPVWVDIAGASIAADLMKGQKTGLYLDQRDNLRVLDPLPHGARVLDCFCYTGTWAVRAAINGAASVTGVDSSAWGLECARANAEKNACEDVCDFIGGDAFEVLDGLGPAGSYDVVILDPPSFAKKRDRMSGAKRRYREINEKAVSLLKSGGLLISCSCSHHLDAFAFRQVLNEAVAGRGRRAVLLEARGQSRDHPVLLAARETEYLKCMILRVL